jgi:hypothetical protein
MMIIIMRLFVLLVVIVVVVLLWIFHCCCGCLLRSFFIDVNLLRSFVRGARDALQRGPRQG